MATILWLRRLRPWKSHYFLTCPRKLPDIASASTDFGALLSRVKHATMSAHSIHTDQPANRPPQPGTEEAAPLGARDWLMRRLVAESNANQSRKRLLICIMIFISALGVRVLQWQDRHVEIADGKSSLGGVFNRYQKEARRMLDEGGILFPREHPANGDARMLVHPPGYSILLAGVYQTGVDTYNALWIVQIVCDAAAALLIFLIGYELFNLWIATIAAILTAFSPHLAYYSLILSPDSLAVVPLLAAIYFFVQAYKRPRLMMIITVGVFLGLSCWLRANALLLAPFLSLVAMALFPRGKRLTYALALSGAAVAVISPITIRNLMVFNHFIPVSIAAGENLVVGIGDYDKQGSLGMPRSDRETRMKDVEWNARPDYAASLWTPDGIERDQTRFARGVEVIRAHPGWFLGVMFRRAGFMLSYNDSRPHDWPEISAIIPPVLAEAGFGHPLIAQTKSQAAMSSPPAVLVVNGTVIPEYLAVSEEQPQYWSNSARQLLNSGMVATRGASAELVSDGRILQITGDGSEYGDQFVSDSIPVRGNFDYALSLPVQLVKGDAALKVTSSDRRISLASSIIPNAKDDLKSGDEETQPLDSYSQSQGITEVQMPFATGNRSEVRIVLSNNGIHTQPVVQADQARLFEIGPTPYVWTRYFRYVVRALQRNIFTTSRMVPMMILGLGILAFAGHWRRLAILLAVPVYYVCAQSPLSTEYRYILAIHYFLFVAVAVTLYSASASIKQGAIWASKLRSLKPKN